MILSYAMRGACLDKQFVWTNTHIQKENMLTKRVAEKYHLQQLWAKQLYWPAASLADFQGLVSKEHTGKGSSETK